MLLADLKFISFHDVVMRLVLLVVRLHLLYLRHGQKEDIAYSQQMITDVLLQPMPFAVVKNGFV